MTLQEILVQAHALADKTLAGSITPEEVGGLIASLALEVQRTERDGSTLGIRKVYPSLEAMRSDTAPTTEEGKALRPGNLAAIYDEATSSIDPNSGLVSMWTGSGWQAVARIGTALRHENTALENRITLLEGDILDALKLKLGELEGQLIVESVLRARTHKEHSERISELESSLTREGDRLSSLITAERGLRAEAGGRLTGLIEAERTERTKLAGSLMELASKGGGGGYYNVTQRHPLGSVYYTLETAVAAVAGAGIKAEERRGMIITFETSALVWADYRYTGGESDEEFASPTLWVAHTALKGVRVGSELKEPVDGVVELPELSVVVATSVDESDRPVSSAAVKAELDSLKGITYDTDTETTDEGTEVTLSHEGRQVARFTVAGGGGTSGAVATKGKVVARLSAPRIKLGDEARLDYSWAHYTDGEQDGIGAELTLSIRRGAQLLHSIPLGTKASGEAGEVDLKGYITGADSYSLSITASYTEEGVAKSRTASATLSVVDLSISLYNLTELESYLAQGGYKDGESIHISLQVRGGARSISMYLDGEASPTETKAISGVGGRQTFIIPAHSLRSGGHSLQFVAELEEVRSNSLYLDILKAGEDEPWVGLYFSRSDGALALSGAKPSLLSRQYEASAWSYMAVGRRGEGITRVTYNEGGVERSFAAPRSMQAQSSRFMSRGRMACSITAGSYTKSFDVEVTPTSLTGIGIKEGTAVELLASGRSNSEANPATWTSGATTTRFEGVDWRSSGWMGEALRLINGARAEVGYPLFATDAKTTGLTLMLELRATNVRRGELSIVSCYDEEGHRGGGFGGLRITPERVSLPTGGRVVFRAEDGEEVSRDLGLDMPYASGEYYHLALVVHPSTDDRTLRLYVNGVLSKADTYQDTILRQQTPQNIVLDSRGADLEVKHLRIYTTALTDDEVLSAYITERSTLGEMQALQQRNDVLDEATGEVSWEKLHRRGKGILSIVLEDGGLERLWGKSTDTKTNYKLRELVYRSPYGRAYDLKVEHAAIRRQGTSTSTYPIKNLRIYLQRKGFDTKVYRNVGKGNEDEWEEVEGRTYTMRPGGKPMSIINLKTDYADSSLCYNTGGSLLLDYLLRANPQLRTPGMVADEGARFGIDGMPIDVFTSDSPEGAKRYCGQFQLNNDKSKSGYLFGQTKKDGTEIALELINNTNAVANFDIRGDVVAQLGSRGSDGFDASVEFLYPEKDYLWNGKKGAEDTAPENIKGAVIRLWQWIKDCTPSEADPSEMTTEEVRQRFVSHKFKSEVARYFSVENLALWWVWTDYTMAVDQRVKNTFFRTWDGLRWYLTYYDGDTSMGKRNDAFLAYLYNIGRDTLDAQRGKYAFEGHGSRLWALVVANLEEKIKLAAQTMRTTLTDAVFRRVYNEQIMRSWSERQYNKSGIYKYIKPTYTDYNGGGTMNYIFALGGTMYAYRNQLIDRRFSLLDARYQGALVWLSRENQINYKAAFDLAMQFGGQHGTLPVTFKLGTTEDPSTTASIRWRLCKASTSVW